MLSHPDLNNFIIRVCVTTNENSCTCETHTHAHTFMTLLSLHAEILTVQLAIHQEGFASEIWTLFLRTGGIVLRKSEGRGRRGMRRGPSGHGG